MKKDLLLAAYTKGCEVRIADSLVAEHYHKGYIRCPTHLSIGQELVPSILSLFTNENDLAVSTHRSHGHYLGKGGNIQKFFDELHGLNSGCSQGRGGSMHLIDTSVGFYGSTAIVGNTIPVGVGLSEAQSLSASKSLTYIFLGEGATEEGVFYESLNYSSVRTLPCIFIIENNKYSVYTPIQPRQKDLSISKKIQSFGIPYLEIDNHDYKKLYSSWLEAVNHARSGKGPIALEVMTHRKLEHCGPNSDDQLGYRPQSLLNKWGELDIINIYINALKNYDYTEDQLLNIYNQIKDSYTSIFLKSQEQHIKLRK